MSHVRFSRMIFSRTGLIIPQILNLYKFKKPPEKGFRYDEFYLDRKIMRHRALPPALWNSERSTASSSISRCSSFLRSACDGSVVINFQWSSFLEVCRCKQNAWRFGTIPELLRHGFQ